MKKRKFLRVLAISCMSVVAATSAFGMVACGGDDDEAPKHEHTYSETWNNDTTNHWHDATCEHATEKGSLGAHDKKGTDGACSVCGYKDTTVTPPPAHEHTYATDWSKDETNHWHAATCEHTTEKKDEAAHVTNGTGGACSVCGYKDTTVTPPPVHGHTYSTTWEKDDTKHWQTCTGDDCTEAAGTHFNEAAHDTNGTDGACSVCGYKATVTPPPVHEHTYAETLSSDENGHWYAATCDHTTEKKDASAHVDANNDGVCDDCNFGTVATKAAELLAKQGATKVVAENFIVNRTLPTFEDWGTAGVYQGYGTNGNDTTNYVEIKDGKADIKTPNTNPATYLYVDFGTIPNGTIIEGYFEVSGFLNGLTGYTPIQVAGIGGAKEEVFGFRANTKWEYRLDGGSNVAVTGAPNIEGSKIYFSYNTTTNNITVTVNDTAFVTDVHLSGTNLKGIKFSSGDGNNKMFSVDNIAVIYTAIPVDEYKTTANANVTALETAANALKSGENWSSDSTATALTTAKTTATDAITAATTLTAVDEAYAAYETAVLAAIKTEYEARFATAYPATDYTVEDSEGVTGNKTPYNTTKNTLSTELEAATTLTAQTAAYTKAITAAADINKNDWYQATKYTLTFANADLEAVEYADSEVTVAPTAPTAADSKFVGWYSDAACTTAYTFGSALTEDTTIYAKWHGVYTINTLQDILRLEGLNHEELPTNNSTITFVSEKNKFGTQATTMTEVVNGETKTYTSALKTGGKSDGKSGQELSIKIVLTEKSNIHVAMRTGSNGTERSAFIATKISSSLSDAVSSEAKASNSDTSALSSFTVTLEAGTYYLNCTDNIQIFAIVIASGEIAEKELTDINGTVTLGVDDSVDLSNVTFSVAGSASETISAATLGNKVVAELSADKTTVTIKYGKLVKVLNVTAVTAE